MNDFSAPRIRLFFAFELTEPIREFASTAQSTLIDRVGRRDIRWTNPVDMHITALFLGNHENECLPVFESAGRAAATAMPPFDLAVGGLGRFPERGAPRVVWMGGGEGEDKPATAVIARLRAKLSEYPLDTKPFKPHITLGYVRPEANRQAVDGAIRNATSTELRTLRVERLVLMQTISDAERRNSGNARYTIVHAFPFGATA